MKNLANNGEDGFSLLELVIAIGVILVLAASVMIGYGGYKDNARQAMVEDAAQKTATGALAYESGGTGSAEDAVEAYNKSAKPHTVAVALDRRENGCMRFVATYTGHDNESVRSIDCGTSTDIGTDDGGNNSENPDGGFDEDGFDKDGYDKDGFDRSGFDKDGYDRDGFNDEGFGREGFDRDGYTSDGFDRDGKPRDDAANSGGNTEPTSLTCKHTVSSLGMLKRHSVEVINGSRATQLGSWNSGMGMGNESKSEEFAYNSQIYRYSASGSSNADSKCDVEWVKIDDSAPSDDFYPVNVVSDFYFTPSKHSKANISSITVKTNEKRTDRSDTPYHSPHSLIFQPEFLKTESGGNLDFDTSEWTLCDSPGNSEEQKPNVKPTGLLLAVEDDGGETYSISLDFGSVSKNIDEKNKQEWKTTFYYGIDSDGEIFVSPYE